jgi:hypothetical protein
MRKKETNNEQYKRNAKSSCQNVYITDLLRSTKSQCDQWTANTIKVKKAFLNIPSWKFGAKGINKQW